MNTTTRHKYRKIDPRIWLDADFRTWGDDGRLAFLFLLTHPLQSALGAMRGTIPGLAAELGWHERRLREGITLALAHGSVVIDETSALIWLPNFLKYNPPESVNVVKAWRGAFESLPECALKYQIYQGVKAYAEGLTEAFRYAFTHAMPEGSQESYVIPGTGNSEQGTVNSDKDTPAADAASVVSRKPKAKKPPFSMTDTSPEFREFFAHMPNQEDPATAWANWQTLLKKVDVTPADLIQAAKNYEADCQAKGQADKFFKASNFVGRLAYYQNYLPGVYRVLEKKPEREPVLLGFD